MAEAKGPTSTGGAGASASGGSHASPATPAAGSAPGARSVQDSISSIKRLWPIPVLGLALVMFVAGLVVAFAKRPKPDAGLPLLKAGSLVETQKYNQAIEYLNSDVKPFFDQGLMTPAQERQYHLALGRAFAGAIQIPGSGFGVPFNHKVVVESFEKAEKLAKEGAGDVPGEHPAEAPAAKPAGKEAEPASGHSGHPGAPAPPAHAGSETLAPPDLSLLVDSLLALGRTDEAIERIGTLPERESARRTRLIKSVVEHTLAQSDAITSKSKRAQLALDLLATLSTATELSPADRAWVLARQAELLIASGNPEEAINKLIRRIGLMRDVPAPQQAELLTLLGKAYFQSDQLPDAGKQLELADSMLPAGNPLKAEIGVLLGRIAQANGQLDQAKDRFQGVMGEFASSRVYPRALLGSAEVLAANRDSESEQQASLERYAELADLVKQAELPSSGTDGAPIQSKIDVSREALTQSLMRRFDERFSAGRNEEALRFGLMAESLYRDNQVPPEILEGIGRAHRRLGDEAMQQAAEGHGVDFRVDDLDKTTRAEVKRHYVEAGEYLRRHAAAIVASDLSKYSRSLWDAADSFDLAGDLEESKKTFQQYADGAPDNDPNKPAAKFRLAQAYQARKEITAAKSLYRELVDGRTRSSAPDAQTGNGRWGEQAIVPLAECLLAEREPGNQDEAERLLTGVVDGSIMSPDAAEYRSALIELGTMYYTVGHYPDAISRLEQAIERYPEDRRVEAIRFRLADSHRLEAGRIRKTLEQALPQSQRDELEQARVDHLKTARRMFERVRQGLMAGDMTRLTKLEKTYLRNAHFYIGDCAFDLKDYDGAVTAYDTARLRYPDDPASLVAMAQIVSAYVAQQRWAEARTANERARQQLAKFPEDVWSRPDLPMEKRHWERWLEARTQLEQMAHAKE